MTPAEFRAARLSLGLGVVAFGRELGLSRVHINRLELPENHLRHRSVTKTVEILVNQLTAAENAAPRRPGQDKDTQA